MSSTLKMWELILLTFKNEKLSSTPKMWELILLIFKNEKIE
ncbi:hypothetical protein LEP1GSC170_4712 [Leptospira interrogans serovar Bataviae str. HAI135]|nr:hypothetical protein LEP1GSC170_4712 [Leptospira interrogans serovar Bataviae str. HAI135]